MTAKNKNRTVRTCLKCGKPFLSDGNWNRFCVPCTQKNATVTMPPEARSEPRSGREIVHHSPRD